MLAAVEGAMRVMFDLIKACMLAELWVRVGSCDLRVGHLMRALYREITGNSSLEGGPAAMRRLRSLAWPDKPAHSAFSLELYDNRAAVCGFDGICASLRNAYMNPFPSHRAPPLLLESLQLRISWCS